MMNKLISELAESCMIEKYNQHGNLIEDGFDYGKFAELIVRECAQLVVDDDNAYDILKHFGVEE